MSDQNEVVLKNLVQETMKGIWGCDSPQQASELVAKALTAAQTLDADEVQVEKIALQLRGFLNGFALHVCEDGEARYQGWLEGFVAAVGAAQPVGARTELEFKAVHAAMYDVACSRLTAAAQGVNLAKLVSDMVSQGAVALVQSRLAMN